MDWLNPVEWLAWLYGKLFLGHPFVGGVLVVVSFAALGMVLWIRGVDKYKEEHAERRATNAQLPSASPSPSAPEPPSSAKSSGAEHHTERNPAGAQLRRSLVHKPPINSSGSSSTPNPSISAPYGIAISGGNVTNPTVNNFSRPQRHLSQEQKAQLIALLAPYKDTPFSGIYALGQDAEGNVYAQEFFQVFKAAGWNVGLMVGQNFGMTVDDPAHPIPEGLWIIVNADEKDSPPAAANSLYKILRTAGLNPKGMSEKNLPKGTVQLLIGMSDLEQ